MPRVSILDTEKFFDVNENEILYDALADRGEELPHGCLSGSCGACRIEVSMGADKLSTLGVIEKNTVDAVVDEFNKTRGEEFLNGKTVRLACRAKVLGDCTIKPLK